MEFYSTFPSAPVSVSNCQLSRPGRRTGQFLSNLFHYLSSDYMYVRCMVNFQWTFILVLVWMVRLRLRGSGGVMAQCGGGGGWYCLLAWSLHGSWSPSPVSECVAVPVRKLQRKTNTLYLMLRSRATHTITEVIILEIILLIMKFPSNRNSNVSCLWEKEYCSSIERTFPFFYSWNLF